MDGKSQDDSPQDGASIEVLSESGVSHSRSSEWSIYSPGRGSITRSEMSAVDYQKRSVHHDGRQFIASRNSDDGGLPYSAEFYLNGESWKLSGEDCILMLPRRYIAMVNLEDTIDFNEVDDFEEALRMLLKHLKIEKVLMDKELEECDGAKSVLGTALEKLADESGGNIDNKRDVMQLLKLLKKHGNSLNMGFKHDLRKYSRLSTEIVYPLDNYVTKTLKLIQRNQFIDNLNKDSLSDEFISDAIQSAVDRHRAQLAAICPSSMKDKLQGLPDDRILYVVVSDMQLFTDLTTVNGAIFEVALPMIFSKFLTQIRLINGERFVEIESLSKRIFLYICKSMQKVAEELDAHINIGNTIIYSEALGWEVSNLKDELETSYSKCLRQQLGMITKLANHFEPGGSFRKSPFPYEFKLFQNMDAIPEEVRIWLCLLDDCMKDLVRADLDKMQMLSCFFKSYVNFVASEEFESETLECLRTITHDGLRSLAERTSVQQDRITVDSISSKYKRIISRCLHKLPRQYFGNDCEQIESSLQQIIFKALEMKVSSCELSQFSNVFQQLLNDLSDLQLEWFVRLTPSDMRIRLLQSQFIAPVDSIWNDTDHECFKVVDLEGFVDMFRHPHNSEEMPKHYQLKVIQVLLKNLEKFVSRQSCTGEGCFSDKNLLATLTVMTNSIRSSLVLQNEQLDYYSFEDFVLSMSKPWAQTTDKEVQDFPLNDAIDSVEALDPLLDRFQDSISKVLLKDSLKLFTTQFNRHLAGSALLSRDKRIAKIVSDVKSNIEPKLAVSWTEEFKRNELPGVLAGLSAVWSIIVSGIDSSLEKIKKPSHLHVCCILSLFGDKNSFNADDSHQLLQLTSQEGKEFVLGLTAALFALYGHKVEIVCFNSYLTRINSLDWIKVFRSFSILYNIFYESLEGMKKTRSDAIYERFMAYINECFGLETNANNENEPEIGSNDEKCVLLVEDIDVLVQENIVKWYVTRYLTLTIPGLEEVQRKAFCQDKPTKGNDIEQYIEQSNHPNIRKLREYLDRPHSYKMAEELPLQQTEYTNKTLFQEHLELMKTDDTFVKYCSRFLHFEDNTYGYLPLGFIPVPLKSLLETCPIVLSFTSEPLYSFDKLLQFALDHFDIHRTILESDMLQKIPTKFDQKKDFHYVHPYDDQDWMDAITDAILAAIDRNCLVLVFFKNDTELEQLQETMQLKQLNVSAIKTESGREVVRDHNLLCEEFHVLMVCNGYFSKDRQVHVIQTFFSYSEREESLIRRQAERSHSSGSYELLLRTTQPINTDEFPYHKLGREYSNIKHLKCLQERFLEQYNSFKKFLKM